MLFLEISPFFFSPHYSLPICAVLKIYLKPTEITANLQLHKTVSERYLLSLPHLCEHTGKLLR